MKNKILGITVLFLLSFCLTNLGLAQEEDAENCKDHPIFTRMKNYFITNCSSNFDAVEFSEGRAKNRRVEIVKK